MYLGSPRHCGQVLEICKAGASSTPFAWWWAKRSSCNWPRTNTATGCLWLVYNVYRCVGTSAELMCPFYRKRHCTCLLGPWGVRAFLGQVASCVISCHIYTACQFDLPMCDIRSWLKMITPNWLELCLVTTSWEHFSGSLPQPAPRAPRCQECMKYGAALVVMAIGEQGRAVTAKDKVTWWHCWLDPGTLYHQGCLPVQQGCSWLVSFSTSPLTSPRLLQPCVATVGTTGECWNNPGARLHFFTSMSKTLLNRIHKHMA